MCADVSLLATATKAATNVAAAKHAGVEGRRRVERRPPHLVVVPPALAGPYHKHKERHAKARRAGEPRAP